MLSMDGWDRRGRVGSGDELIALSSVAHSKQQQSMLCCEVIEAHGWFAYVARLVIQQMGQSSSGAVSLDQQTV